MASHKEKDALRGFSQVLDGIQSSSVTVRKTELQAFRRLLHNLYKGKKESGSLPKLKDRHAHFILETVFKVVAMEQSLASKGGKATATSFDRLEMCADVIKAFVELFKHYMRAKSVKALLSHIFQALPSADGTFCEPLVAGYLACLVDLFSYQPHVEHMDREAWTGAVDFCCQSIEIVLDDVIDDGSFLSSRPSSNRSQSSNITAKGKLLVECLRGLVSAPNSLLMKRAELVIERICSFIKCTMAASRIHQPAFATLNRCLMRVAINDSTLVRKSMTNVLPLIRQLWPKAKDQREHREMLITLVVLQRNIGVVAGSPTGDESTAALVEGLYEVIVEDYISNAGPNQLSLDDLYLGLQPLASLEVLPMQLPAMALKISTVGGRDTEFEWTILRILAFMASWIDVHNNAQTWSGSEEHIQERSPKRRRKSSRLSELITDSLSLSAYSRTRPALQILCMLIQSRKLSEEELLSTMDALIQLLSHQTADIANWSMLCLAACAFQPVAGFEAVKPRWSVAWEFSIRAVSSASTCRISCHLARIILQRQLLHAETVNQAIETMLTSTGANGPASFCDSSLGLWSVVADQRAAHVPGALGNLGFELMVRWMLSKFEASTFNDRDRARQLAEEAPVSATINAFNHALGVSKTNRTALICARLGDVGRSWLWNIETCPLSECLLLYDDKHPLNDLPGPQTYAWTPQSASSVSNRVRLGDDILTFLIAEIDRTSQRWNELRQAKSGVQDPGANCIIFSVCIAGFFVADVLRDTHVNKAEILSSRSLELAQGLIEVASQPGNTLIRQAFLQAISPLVPRLSPEDEFSAILEDIRALRNLWGPLSRMSHVRSRGSNGNAFDIDDEIDDQNEDQATENLEYPHSILEAGSVEASFCATIACSCTLLEQLWQQRESVVLGKSIPDSFIEYMVELPLSTFMSTLPLLHRAFGLRIGIGEKAAWRLSFHFSGKALDSYAWNRSEVTFCMLLDLMICTPTLWTDETLTYTGEDSRADATLSALGAQMYCWLLSVSLETDMCSAASLLLLVDLLYKLLEVAPDYAELSDRPSMRTSLFRLLKHNEVIVQHHIAERLSQVFNSFTLIKHMPILEDILDCLPNDHHLENILIRLTALTRIGCTWKDLLVKCVYGIFTTINAHSDAWKYGRRCISEIATNLHIDDGKDVFRLFCSPILHTWLSNRDNRLEEIPYAIFDYNSLSECIADTEEDIIRFTMPPGHESQLRVLEEVTELKRAHLVKNNFPRVVVYSVAQDLSVKSTCHDSEAKVRDTFGEKSEYISLTKHFYPEVMGECFLGLNQVESMHKCLAKRSKYKYALDALRAINSIGISPVALPDSGNPCWEPVIFVELMERLNRRTDNDLPWQPSVITRIARMLFNSIHPAYGTSHACRVLQRIKLLVCLAGGPAVTGYPLETIMHGLRPFVTDKQCSAYALPLFNFLIDTGRDHLVVHPEFFVGTASCVLLAMRKFLNSTQASGTQEIAHGSVLTKAQDFRNWLCESFFGWFVANLKEPKRSPAKEYRDLLDFARASLDPSRALKGTESRLLHFVLHGYGSPTSLFPRQFSELCLALLSEDFESLLPTQLDIFADGMSQKSVVMSVWSSLQLPGLSACYTAWASRILGLSVSRFGLEPTAEREYNTSTQLGSEHLIVTTLIYYLRSPVSETCGFSEQALSQILQQLTNKAEYNTFMKLMPAHILRAFHSDHSTSRAKKTTGQKPSSGVSEAFEQAQGLPAIKWAQSVLIAIINSAKDNVVLFAILPLLTAVESAAKELFGATLHMLLLSQSDQSHAVGQKLSKCCNSFLKGTTSSTIAHTRILLNAILYLQCQKSTKDRGLFNRYAWLDLDYESAAEAATQCGMYKTALFFVEISRSATQAVPPRFASSKMTEVNEDKLSSPTELLTPILRNVDEPDGFYGIEQPSDLEGISDRLEYEGDDIQSLLFRGAQADSLQRSGILEQNSTSAAVLRSLTKLSLNMITSSFASHHAISTNEEFSSKSLLSAAMKLGQWDLPAPTTASTPEGVIYRTLQSLSTTKANQDMRVPVCQGLLDVCQLIKDVNFTGPRLVSSFHALASLCEIDSLCSARDLNEFKMSSLGLLDRASWMESTSVEHVAPLLISREAFLGILSTNTNARDQLKIDARQALIAEARTVLHSSKIYRTIGGSQEALSSVTYLSQLARSMRAKGVPADAAIKFESANVLWDRGELIGSIKTLQSLQMLGDLSGEALSIGRSGILAELAHHVSHARLENADEILNNYLGPALEHLGDRQDGQEAGKVFHHYATYCHNQLENTDILADFHRSQRFFNQRSAEAQDLEKTLSSNLSKGERDQVARELRKVKRWREMNFEEVTRLSGMRDQFLRSSLENYLKSLAASDEFDTDMIRFLAIWLAHADNQIANEPVGEHSVVVPSRKFAPLTNQLASRLQDGVNEFQNSLSDIVRRICEDHPYHGMYQVFAGSRSKGPADSQSQSRHGAASGLARVLQKGKAGRIWNLIAVSSERYIELASMQDSIFKFGGQYSMQAYGPSRRVARDIPKLQIPPISMGTEIREDMDYNSLPVVTKFDDTFRIPGGVSVPKVVAAWASDGKRYKQIFKGGSDDLRQDAIMEQVFEQVTRLLKHDKATRQRRLRIRTYKVIPLDSNSGVIEFVEPTMSLNEFLERAHNQYHPKDITWSQARQKMNETKQLSVSSKYKLFAEVCSRFSPVLRYFFFENFLAPDDWFDRRLAYTRSTAAMSILGHVLGLGDRHCQNILLDKMTGEVVHIDLGIAFEAGRVLPCPETVPFRLTRDIVDGFGVLKTEGVFRRCCEFTLEALRQDRDTILTLLNVLRYDPLHSWVISPLRAKRLQAEQELRMAEEQQSESTLSTERSKRTGRGSLAELNIPAGPPMQKKQESEGGEADRALGTVERKLASGLSVSATVNELIQQATDPKNLALLFQGWSAWA